MKFEDQVKLESSTRNLVLKKTQVKGKSIIPVKNEKIAKTNFKKFKETTLKNVKNSTNNNTKQFEQLDNVQKLIALNQENKNLREMILGITYNAGIESGSENSASDFNLKPNNLDVNKSMFFIYKILITPKKITYFKFLFASIGSNLSFFTFEQKKF